ncbi:MAG: class A beta-lactamase-related serine hydrolase [Bacteroidetes bacterium CHB5]|nr:class A beta-lactamase-related serine hydrolase [Bacteroidetes bacterium CHB5]
MKYLPITFLLCQFTLSGFSQTTGQINKIDQLFSAWNNASPGVAVAVQQGDKIIYNKAYGLADLEHTIPNTTETIFESGSVAKQFTAMSILLLAAEGNLSLSDDIRKYVPEIPKYNATITIQMLLNHTSGLKDWGSVGSLTGWPRTTRVYTQDLALQIMSKQKSTNFTPGTEYNYSNANYSLLVTIVERVSGKSLAAFTNEKLFKPLGMTHTQWRDNFREVVPHRAIAYRKNKDAYEQMMPFENIHGHGGLLTTTGDLLKWNNLLETHAIGGRAVYEWRVQKGKLANGKEINYAAGLNISKLYGFDEISHSGSTAGYRAWLAYYPEKKLSVVALSNDGSFNPTRMGRQIAEVLLLTDREPLDIPEIKTEDPDSNYAPASYTPTESDLKKFEGIWRSIRHMDVQRIERKENALFNNNIRAAVLDQNTAYFDARWNITKANRVLVTNGTDTLSYIKVAAPDLTGKSLTALTGTYYSEDADATYLVEIKNSEIIINNKPHPPYKLTPTFNDAFFSEDGNLFEFRRDKKGKVIQLLISTGRAIHVPFNKVK